MWSLKRIHDRGSLRRLRLAFVALGLLLLAPLGLLMSSARERLHEQRQLRHEVVAERIFDELERELSDLLERETQRPSVAYDKHTSPSAWAPFIVGYFTASSGSVHALGEGELGASRRTQLGRVLPHWLAACRVQHPGMWSTPNGDDESGAGESSERDSLAKPEQAAVPRAIPSAVIEQHEPPSPSQQGSAQQGKTSNTSPDVLRRLNRGTESRARQSPAKRPDPMLDYSVGF